MYVCCIHIYDIHIPPVNIHVMSHSSFVRNVARWHLMVPRVLPKHGGKEVSRVEATSWRSRFGRLENGRTTCDRYDIPKMLDDVDVDDVIFVWQQMVGYKFRRRYVFGLGSWKLTKRYVKHCTGHDCWSFVLIYLLCFLVCNFLAIDSFLPLDTAPPSPK